MGRLRFVSFVAVILLMACSTEDGETPATASPSPAAVESRPPSAAAPPSPSASATPASPAANARYELQRFPVPAGARPHDVAPVADGRVWYTGQGNGTLGLLASRDGGVREVPLGAGSAPHGVVVGPDGAVWVTDGGLNAIVRVDQETFAVRVFPLPSNRPNVNLNTAAFDRFGRLWFTGQNGIYGRFDPMTEKMEVFDAPRGRGPYGIGATPDGRIYFVSLAGSYLGAVDLETGKTTLLQPPTEGQGARRVWSDSKGVLWVAEWNAGQVASYDPATNRWREWKLPGARPQAYAVYVDDRDQVWLTDFGANAIVRFDPGTEQFETFPLPKPDSAVRQLLGRAGEVWGAASGAGELVVIRRIE